MIVMIVMMIIMIGFFVTLMPALISTISSVAFTPQQTLLINLFGVIILAMAPIILLILANFRSQVKFYGYM